MKYLFDWNGTIADDAGRACDATNAALRLVGVPEISPELFDRSFLLPMDEMFLKLGVGIGDVAAAITEWNAAMAAQAAPLRTGAAGFLADLNAAGEACAVISAAGPGYLLAELRSFDLDERFGAVVTEAADKAQVLAELRDGGEALYFGDTEYDMRCAAEAGCVPVGVLSGYCPEQRLVAAGAELVVRDFDEFRSTALGRRLLPL
ncbi:HAD family hydrolase [Pseudarthrobacter sp. NPDC058362]|uniref:HAD family hydrolase n=1 Tax=Pseudarthrobacter sp. NPDC058362 TaxID=3346458 RepID=UPI00365E80C5